MALTSIPEKIIETKESFNECQLNIALELTKLLYQSPQSQQSKEEILNTFFHYFEQIKEISPPPLDKIKSHKIYYSVVTGILIVISIAGIILYSRPTLKEILLKLA